jgi:hypothetical protein
MASGWVWHDPADFSAVVSRFLGSSSRGAARRYRDLPPTHFLGSSSRGAARRYRDLPPTHFLGSSSRGAARRYRDPGPTHFLGSSSRGAARRYRDLPPENPPAKLVPRPNNPGNRALVERSRLGPAGPTDQRPVSIPAPNWYPDPASPSNSTTQRWWDGAQWSAHTRQVFAAPSGPANPYLAAPTSAIRSGTSAPPCASSR